MKGLVKLLGLIPSWAAKVLSSRGKQSDPEQQLLVEYQVLQGIAEHEVQTVYLTFAVFFPLLLTASASLVGVLLSDNLKRPGVFLGLGSGGTLVTFVLIWAWWRVANRRQQIRRKAFKRQVEIESALGGHIRKGTIFEGLGTTPLVRPRWLEHILLPGTAERRRESPLPSGATFVNLMRLFVWAPLLLWVLVLGIGMLGMLGSTGFEVCSVNVPSVVIPIVTGAFIVALAWFVLWMWT